MISGLNNRVSEWGKLAGNECDLGVSDSGDRRAANRGDAGAQENDARRRDGAAPVAACDSGRRRNTACENPVPRRRR
ncbi:MAG: hypothetical protein WDM87_18065 [Terracidiphilus sp.]